MRHIPTTILFTCIMAAAACDTEIEGDPTLRDAFGEVEAISTLVDGEVLSRLVDADGNIIDDRVEPIAVDFALEQEPELAELWLHTSNLKIAGDNNVSESYAICLYLEEQMMETEGEMLEACSGMDSGNATQACWDAIDVWWYTIEEWIECINHYSPENTGVGG